MKIDSHSVQQSSEHRLSKSRSETESLEMWAGDPQAAGAVQDESSYILDFKSDSFQQTTQRAQLRSDARTAKEQETDTRIKLLESLVYQLTGKRIKFRVNSTAVAQSSPGAADIGFDAPPSGETGNGWGMVYEYQEIVTEEESVKFNSGGYVTTADGRTISFNLELQISRAFYQEARMSVRMGDAAKMIDPLVVVFGSGPPTLSASRHAFDLDADGKMDNIAFATGGSGFLALDRNGDGVIGDGSELFGTQSGNGFVDLAKYDTDKNGWIDEGDEVFGQLMLLTLTQDGEKTLFKLGDVGIGAIYLNDISTQFEIRDEAGQYGQMQSSSVFVRENGTVGAIHHIDLSV